MSKQKPYTPTRPITQWEFDILIERINKKYKNIISEIYNYGTSLTLACSKNKINRRNLQHQLKKYNMTYMCLREGFIAKQLSKGFTMESVREKLGLSSRKDLNNLMWQKVRGDIKPGTRWRILKRDNFRCVLCGADATDRKLHIDHIIPVSKNGKSVMKNLRVLCSQCNLGRNIDLKEELKSD